VIGISPTRESLSDPYQSYLTNITQKTGKTPEEIAAMLKDAGALKPGVKANVIVGSLKDNLGLGHGHAVAIVKRLKEHDEM
jgi:hypothetical protein